MFKMTKLTPDRLSATVPTPTNKLPPIKSAGISHGYSGHGTHNPSKRKCVIGLHCPHLGAKHDPSGKVKCPILHTGVFVQTIEKPRPS